MQFDPADDCVSMNGPGVWRGRITFSNRRLAAYAWPACEIVGAAPGPRLCISAGVHVNEVSSIEAAVRLQGLFEPAAMRGSVSIMPLVNLPAQHAYTEYLCPEDGKNINFSFPGDPSGSFTEALCDAIQNEWCADADCYVDLHGGDLRETVSKFSMYQRTDDAARDARGRRYALAFDADIVVGLDPSLQRAPGRPPTGFARRRRIAIMSEAGANGRLDEESIAFHVNGVLGVARDLGILPAAPVEFQRRRIPCRDYIWVPCPASGLFYSAVEPAEKVRKGQALGEIRNLHGDAIASLPAPVEGLILWRLTHPIVKEGVSVLAIAVPEAS